QTTPTTLTTRRPARDHNHRPTPATHRRSTCRPPPQYPSRARARARGDHSTPAGQDTGHRCRGRASSRRLPDLPLHQLRRENRCRQSHPGDRRPTRPPPRQAGGRRCGELARTYAQRRARAQDRQPRVIAQRTRIGELLGRIRDLEAEWTQDAIQRVTTENTTLKQRVRQLTADNRTLDERLNAARSNLRFQDRRIADLEARLADPSAAR